MQLRDIVAPWIDRKVAGMEGKNCVCRVPVEPVFDDAGQDVSSHGTENTRKAEGGGKRRG
jgi:hypothetical protein